MQVAVNLQRFDQMEWTNKDTLTEGFCYTGVSYLLYEHTVSITLEG
jgi:hypothetical protein